MSTMNVSLTPELDKFVREKTASGQFTSASEVIRMALRMMERDEASESMRLEILRREVGIGLEQAKAQRFSKRTVGQIAVSVVARHSVDPE